MNLKFKLGPSGFAPVRKTELSVCYDILLPHDIVMFGRSSLTFSLDIAFDIPNLYYICLYPRSSTFTKYHCLSPVSIIDPDYKDYIHGQLYNTKDDLLRFERGQSLFQFELRCKTDSDLEQVGYILPSGRGGLGSTGL